jgi:serine/threonine protein kinase
MAPMLAMNEWFSSEDASSSIDGVNDETGIPAVGALIGGAYRITALLGTGSMGAVFLAHDETLDRDVAIKFARSRLLDASLRARFLTEARAMARISHPNVVKVFAFGEYEGEPYFVMEFVQSGTLTHWMSGQSELPALDVCLRMLDELCLGVSAIHAADIAHRDIKPDNVLLDDELRPHIADLGLAVFEQQPEKQRVREFAGTPAYMAPEIAFSRGVDPALRVRADVYSVACVAYHLLTGHPPFDGAGNVGMLLQHALNPVVAPTRLRPELPAELDAVLVRALAKNPRERTPSVEEFRRELAAAKAEPVVVLASNDNAEPHEPVSRVVVREFAGDEPDRAPADVTLVARVFAAAQ